MLEPVARLPKRKGLRAMPSGFAWVDFSEEDRRKMTEVIDLFREQDTRDELGLGAVRDGLADLMFPGTSTIQTRARPHRPVRSDPAEILPQVVGSTAKPRQV